MDDQPRPRWWTSIIQFLLGIAMIAGIGYLFTILRPAPELPEGFHSIYPPNDVMAIALYQDQVWCGGKEGLFQINRETFELIEEIKPVNAFRFVSALLVTDQGRSLWVGHSDGLSRYDGKNWITYTLADGLLDNEVLSLAQAPNGDLWVGTANGLLRVSDQDWTTFTTADGLASNTASVLYFDSAGRLWAASRDVSMGGVSVFNGQTWQAYTSQDGLAHDVVNTFFESPPGTIWFGAGFSSYGGLTRFDGHAWDTIDSEDGLLANNVRLIYQDRLNIIWIGSEYSGIKAYNAEDPVAVLTPDNGLVGWEVKSMFHDTQGNLWFGTERGLTVIEGWAYRSLIDQ